MKIICQSCQSKYNVADDKVQGKVVKIRCRKCGTTIVVNGGGATASANGATSAPRSSPAGSGEADAAAASGAAIESGAAPWHVNVADDDQRTMALDDLAKAHRDGLVTHDTYVWTEGMEDWKPLGEVDAVVAALSLGPSNAQLSNGAGHDTVEHDVAHHAHAGRPVPAVPNLESDDGSESYDATRVYDMASVSGGEVAAAHARRDAVSPSSGGEPRSAEPKRAAVLKRDARARDLFASRVSADEARPDVQTSAPIYESTGSGGGGSHLGAKGESLDDAANKRTGERNENSVLFSLAVLTKGAEERAPAGTEEGGDDSGLIDLKALAAKTESMRPPATMADASVLAPALGAMPPLGAPVGVMASPLGDVHTKSRLPMWIGGGALVALLLVAGIAIGVKIAGGSSMPATAGGAPSAATAPPSDTAAATAADTATTGAASAAPSGAPAASASVAATAKPKPSPAAAAAYHPPAPKPAATATAAADSPAPAAAPPAAKKTGGDCGCNGDLMCLMKCSTH